jgi:hypothetical protein
MERLNPRQLPGLGGEVDGDAVTELKKGGKREREGEDTLAEPGSRGGNTTRNLIEWVGERVGKYGMNERIKGRGSISIRAQFATSILRLRGKAKVIRMTKPSENAGLSVKKNNK